MDIHIPQVATELIPEMIDGLENMYFNEPIAPIDLCTLGWLFPSPRTRGFLQKASQPLACMSLGISNVHESVYTLRIKIA